MKVDFGKVLCIPEVEESKNFCADSKWNEVCGCSSIYFSQLCSAFYIFS